MQLKVQTTENGIAVSGVTDFDPRHTFECGQCFRWIRQPDGSYEGVAGGRHARVRMEHGVMFMDGATPEDFEKYWFDYFDFGRDYGALKKEFAAIDPHMKAAVEFGDGMRLLRQDMWETLVSFITSANNQIPRIAKSLDALSCEFGTRVDKPAGRGSHYIFPTPEDLENRSPEELSSCKAGFRCKYINQAVAMALRGDINLQAIRALPTADEARGELMRIPGVGEKVADCVLLFSGARYDVFPIDVWVKRVMETLYFGRETKNPVIQEFAARHFGEMRGIAQQYLFYYARMNKIGFVKKTRSVKDV